MLYPSTSVPVPYINNSGEAIPRWAVMALKNNADVAVTGVDSISVVKPASSGPYAIDAGGGSDASGAQQYGQCLFPYAHPVWAYYIGGSAPGVAWTTEVGPVSGQWYMNSSGTGYYYAGVTDVANQRILVQQKSGGGGFPTIRFQITTSHCDEAEAEAIITSVSCGADSPKIGDMIIVVDLDGWFSGESSTPVDTLAGRVGSAHKFNIPDDDSYDSCTWVILVLAGGELSC